LIFQPKWNERRTTKLLEVKPASAAVTILFTASGSKFNEAVLTADGAI
jgi:hypothetical protein